jgi:hypothetical protein
LPISRFLTGFEQQFCSEPQPNFFCAFVDFFEDNQRKCKYLEAYKASLNQQLKHQHVKIKENCRLV